MSNRDVTSEDAGKQHGPDQIGQRLGSALEVLGYAVPAIAGGAVSVHLRIPSPGAATAIPLVSGYAAADRAEAWSVLAQELAARLRRVSDILEAARPHDAYGRIGDAKAALDGLRHPHLAPADAAPVRPPAGAILPDHKHEPDTEGDAHADQSAGGEKGCGNL